VLPSLNICLISREYPPDTAFGGMATFSRDTALMLQERGHRVTVMSQCLSQSHVINDQGVQVYKIRIPRPFDSYRHLSLFIPAFNTMVICEVLKQHRKKAFDLIDVPDHLAEGLFATYSGIPVVTRLHTPFTLIAELGLNDYEKDLSFLFIKKMEQIALCRSSMIYAPCLDLVRRCNALFGTDLGPVKIFGYPLDIEIFKPLAPAKIGIAQRILFIGRFEQRKGIETIAGAFAKLSNQYPNCTLTLLGSDTPNISNFPSARLYLETQFRRAGCFDKVNFENYVPLEKLPEIFSRHEIVWVPSLYDNYPLICLEAMACGKAVVVSDAGGLPEMVQNGKTGMVFSTGDADALASQTSALFDDSKLCRQLGHNARIYVEENCSINVIYESTMEMYQMVLDLNEKQEREG
jgi:glycosyltransferase involved in cell wall biosynthesis